MGTKNYYEVLQVDRNAEQEVIEAAYKRLARKYHPDVDKSLGAHDHMKLLNETYEVLKDPEKRRLYDEKLGGTARPKPEQEPAQQSTPPPPPPSTDYTQPMPPPSQDYTQPAPPPPHTAPAAKTPKSKTPWIVVGVIGIVLLLYWSAITNNSNQRITPTQTAQQTLNKLPTKTLDIPLPFSYLISVNQFGKIEVIDGLNNVIKTISVEGGNVAKIAWSPNGLKIAYPCNFNTNQNHAFSICVANAVGSDSRQLITAGNNASEGPAVADLTWSPDGTKIAFSLIRFPDGIITEGAIALVDVDNPVIHKVAWEDRASDGYTQPSWSPTGDRLAVRYRDGTGGYNIYIIDLNGNRHQKVSIGNNNAHPAWSPDGQRIAYGGGRNELCVVNIDGTNRQCAPVVYDIMTAPSWSPDGKWITFDYCNIRSGYRDVCIIPSDNMAAPRFIVEGNNPSWIPNSSR